MAVAAGGGGGGGVSDASALRDKLRGVCNDQGEEGCRALLQLLQVSVVHAPGFVRLGLLGPGKVWRVLGVLGSWGSWGS